MSLSGNRVTIQRQDAPSFGGGVHYTYDGTIAADGSFSGINSGTYPVKGTVRCGEVLSPEPPAPSTTSDPGATLVVIYPNVCVAIWTRARPGVYDAVTVCQGPNNTSFREVLTVEAYDGRNVTINRPNYGRYRGTLSADRRTITGICNWKGCTADVDWTAYVDLDWRRSPQLK